MTPHAPAGDPNPGACEHLLPQYTAHRCPTCRDLLESYRQVIRAERQEKKK